MLHSRRLLLSAMGVALPFGFASRAKASEKPPVSLRFRSFEESIRTSFSHGGQLSEVGTTTLGRTFPICRIEIGHSDLVQAGIQGCYNDRPFAGFPAGSLRIVATGALPGPLQGGIRLYLSTVDVALTGGLIPNNPGRPLDFSSVPPAPTFA